MVSDKEIEKLNFKKRIEFKLDKMSIDNDFNLSYIFGFIGILMAIAQWIVFYEAGQCVIGKNIFIAILPIIIIYLAIVTIISYYRDIKLEKKYFRR